MACDANCTHLDSLSGFTSMFIFILLDNIHAISAEKLGTMSKNNSKWITLGMRPAWEELSYLHLLLVQITCQVKLNQVELFSHFD